MAQKIPWITRRFSLDLTLGCFYHIYNRGINSETLFKEARNYSYFLDKYNQYLSPVVNTLAYCLLGNHFHLLILVKEQSENPTGTTIINNLTALKFL
ncbi:hypothetical protein MNBD_BACTEROID06-1301 [hydrothermal vent metagenome]|uniref:Transposase IS200-like domain-containing protein n=1 Tax=hydrothermal vent metagenome TaxID=652676 RepID=A0A3B0V3U0_9ZZZZ